MTRKHKIEFDVVIVGAGMAGAMAAYKLAMRGAKVLMLEAGDEVKSREKLVDMYARSSTKSPDSPYDGLVAPQPDDDKSGLQYYDEPPTALFKSYYERLVGGATWHWQGINIRMLPNEFKINTLYNPSGLKKGYFDWPLSYVDLEPFYCDAENEMGVSGSDEETERIFKKLFGAYRSRPFPMPPIPASYMDKQYKRALDGKMWTPPGEASIPLAVTHVAQAKNSRMYDGRPACDGRGSCIPLCPTKAKYEAIVHVEKALKAGVLLRKKAVVTHLEVDPDGTAKPRIRGVHYITWDGSRHFVSGKVIVVAANGIETPKLLLSSPWGNITVANSNKKRLVGKYLMDHPVKSSFGLAKDPVYPFRGPSTTSDIETMRDGVFRSTRAAFKTSLRNDGWLLGPGALRGSKFAAPNGPWRPQGTVLDFVVNGNRFGDDLRNQLKDHASKQILLNSATDMLAYEENAITLSDYKDRQGIARPKISFCLDPISDNYCLNAFKAIFSFHEFVFDAMGTAADDRHHQLDKSNQVSLAAGWGGSGHIMGTTIMGNLPENSVVNSYGKSWDHPNLFILGSSVFPSSSTANPTLTIAALTLRSINEIELAIRE